MKRLSLFFLSFIFCLSVSAQEESPLEKYVSEYYTYMKSLPVPKPDKSVLTEILNLANVEPGSGFTIDGVVQAPGKTKDELFDSSMQYLVDIFKDSKSVIQMQDKESGIIVGKGTCKAIAWFDEFLLGRYAADERLAFTIKLQFKDGRYRCEIYNVSCQLYATLDKPIELYLIPEFYEKGHKSDDGIVDYSSKRYINLRSQLLVTGLRELFGIKSGLQAYIETNTTNNKNDW